VAAFSGFIDARACFAGLLSTLQPIKIACIFTQTSWKIAGLGERQAKN
jgi:hypothetical protein